MSDKMLLEAIELLVKAVLPLEALRISGFPKEIHETLVHSMNESIDDIRKFVIVNAEEIKALKNKSQKGTK